MSVILLRWVVVWARGISINVTDLLKKSEINVCVNFVCVHLVKF